jgi:DNA polymerase-3 subunit epsilon
MSFAFASLRRLLDGLRASAPEHVRWVVIDTETSGLDPQRDALLAIGAVVVQSDGIVLNDSFEVVLRSDAPGDTANVVVHGIGRDAQAGGVPPPDALAAFERWRAGAPCVGFHAEFDRAVLRRALRASGIDASESGWLDVAPLAAALLPEAHRRGVRSLDEWLETLGIRCELRHNAAADALATAELLLRLRAIAARQGSTGFAALARTARQHQWLGSPN